MLRFVLLVLFLSSTAAADDSGFFSLTSDRLVSPFTPSGAVLLGFGTAGALLTENLERPEHETRFLEWAPFEPTSDIGNAFGAGEFVLGSSLAVWSLGAWSGSERTAALGRDLTATFIATGAWVWALKLVVAEPRPNGAPHSFPSGHTAVAFSSATVLHRHLGVRWGFLGYTLATMTAAARMEDRRHFMRDVTFGATLGLAVGGLQLPMRRWFRGVGVSPQGVSYSGGF